MKAEARDARQFKAREFLGFQGFAVFEHAAVEMREGFLAILDDMDVHRLLEEPPRMECLQLEWRLALPQSVIGQEADRPVLVITQRRDNFRQVFGWSGISLCRAFPHGFAQQIK